MDNNEYLLYQWGNFSVRGYMRSAHQLTDTDALSIFLQYMLLRAIQGNEQKLVCNKKNVKLLGDAKNI